MKKFLGLVIVFVLIVFASSGCYYYNEENLYSSLGCDTASVKYSAQVATILLNNCLPCHSNSNAATMGNGVSFEGYANISDYLSYPSQKTKLINNINWATGATNMPKNGSKLSECNIRTLEIWIENGYPNN